MNKIDLYNIGINLNYNYLLNSASGGHSGAIIFIQKVAESRYRVSIRSGIYSSNLHS